MKKLVLKRTLFPLSIILILSAFGFSIKAQEYEMLTGGSMEEVDEDSWNVEIIGRMETEPTGDQIPEYEFGSSETASKSDGKTLHVWAAGTGYVNIIFSQEVTLKANTKYVTDAAFKDLTGELNNFWAQLKLSLDGEPPQHENDGIKLKGFNTWAGCGQYADGTFSEDACDSDVDGYGYVTPDSLGEEFTAYFGVVVGMWTNAETGAIPYDVVIDEVSLIDSLAKANYTSSIAKLNNKKGASLINYPNPFSESTTLKYEIPERSEVEIFIYNILGEEIFYRYEGVKQSGKHQAQLKLQGTESNLLICKLKYNNNSITRKMTLIR